MYQEVCRFNFERPVQNEKKKTSAAISLEKGASEKSVEIETTFMASLWGTKLPTSQQATSCTWFFSVMYTLDHIPTHLISWKKIYVRSFFIRRPIHRQNNVFFQLDIWFSILTISYLVYPWSTTPDNKLRSDTSFIPGTPLVIRHYGQIPRLSMDHHPLIRHYDQIPRLSMEHHSW